MKEMFLIGMMLLLAGAVSAEKGKSDCPEVWMAHFRHEALAADGAKWGFVGENLDAYKFYINEIAYSIPQDKLGRLVSTLKKNHVKIAVECGYFDWYTECTDFTAPNPKGTTDVARESFEGSVGEYTALTEMRKIANLTAAGGTPDYLDLDGPIRRMMHPGSAPGRTDIKGFDTTDKAADELIDYMRAWRAKFPNIQFFALTNFPNWGWKGEVSYWGIGENGMFWGDYYEVIRTVITKTRAAGIPILGLTADNPYEYAIGTRPSPGLSDPKQINWMGRLLELERYVESRGIEFNLIVNSETGGMTSDEAFYTETLKFLDAYRSAGGSPKRYIIQSWYPYPTKIVPETEPYTMTALTKKAIEKIKPAESR